MWSSAHCNMMDAIITHERVQRVRASVKVAKAIARDISGMVEDGASDEEVKQMVGMLHDVTEQASGQHSGAGEHNGTLPAK